MTIINGFRIGIASYLFAGLTSVSGLINMGLNPIGNHDDVKPHSCYIQRVDGLYGNEGSTSYFSFSNNYDYREEEVHQKRVDGLSKLVKNGGLVGEFDELVDRIHITGDEFSVVLFRDKDYVHNEEEFARADRILAETRERFKDELPSHCFNGFTLGPILPYYGPLEIIPGIPRELLPEDIFPPPPNYRYTPGIL